MLAPFPYFRLAVEPISTYTKLKVSAVPCRFPLFTDTSGANVAAEVVTGLIAFKHTFILIIHLFSVLRL